MKTAQEPIYLTLEEYRQRVSLSLSTIRRRVRDGSIPSWQPGGPGTRVLIPVDSTAKTVSYTTKSGKALDSSTAHQVQDTMPGPTPKWKQKRSSR